MEVSMNIFERLRKERHKDKNYPEKSWSVADLVEAFKKVDPNSKIDRNKINRIENGSQSPDAKTLIAYSKVFDVSVDYLLGLTNSRYLDENIAMISKTTGLSDTAINTLSSWHKYQIKMKQASQEQIYFPIETLNILLSNDDMEWLLRGVQDLLKPNYKIPAYHNGESELTDINDKYQGCRVPKYIVPDSDYDVVRGHGGYEDLYLLTLVQDKTKTWDNIQIPLDKDFFETVAFQKIESHLRNIRDRYLQERTDANETP